MVEPRGDPRRSSTSSAPTSTVAAGDLVDLANQNGGRDNISVILVRVPPEFLPSASWAQRWLAKKKQAEATAVDGQARPLPARRHRRATSASRKERITIGRRADNDICLPYPAVSGEHAAIVTILADSFLEDLGSTNGTLVNDRRSPSTSCAIATDRHRPRDPRLLLGRRRRVRAAAAGAAGARPRQHPRAARRPPLGALGHGEEPVHAGSGGRSSGRWWPSSTRRRRAR